MLVSRDQTRNTLQNRERSADSGRGQTATRGSNQSFSTRVPQSASSENLAFKELQQNYEKLWVFTFCCCSGGLVLWFWNYCEIYTMRVLKIIQTLRRSIHLCFAYAFCIIFCYSKITFIFLLHLFILLKKGNKNRTRCCFISLLIQINFY